MTGWATGILGQIFTKSQNKIQDPAKLFKIISMIDVENLAAGLKNFRAIAMALQD